MEWKIEFSRTAVKDAKKLKSANLEAHVRELLELLKSNPYQPAKGYYSRRINIKHRLVYSINDETKTIRVVSVWSHYE